MSIEHVSIADADRHEVKHASTATLNQTLLANGDGTTRFADIDYSFLVNVPDSHGYSRIIVGNSAATTQAPSATNTPIKVEFGSAQTVGNVALAADGTLTINETGEYIIVANFNYGRGALTGVSRIVTRAVIDGSQADPSHLNTLADATAFGHRTIVRPHSVAGSSTLYFQLYRDSSGNNEGGLYSLTPAVAGWSVVPTASISVYKYQG